jgi:hypothetical protein
MARASTQDYANALDQLTDLYSTKISNAEAVGVLVLKIIGIALQSHDEDDDE